MKLIEQISKKLKPKMLILHKILKNYICRNKIILAILIWKMIIYNNLNKIIRKREFKISKLMEVTI